jgi:hypothetical protein
MAAILATVQQVLDLAPELEDAEQNDPTRFALIVDTITACMLVQSHWGTKLDEGHRTLAAHFCLVEFLPAALTGGTVSARSFDKMSIAYSTGSFEDPELPQSKYGRMHIQLRTALSIRQSRSVSEGNLPPDFELPDRRIL